MPFRRPLGPPLRRKGRKPCGSTPAENACGQNSHLRRGLAAGPSTPRRMPPDAAGFGVAAAESGRKWDIRSFRRTPTIARRLLWLQACRTHGTAKSLRRTYGTGAECRQVPRSASRRWGRHDPANRDYRLCRSRRRRKRPHSATRASAGAEVDPKLPRQVRDPRPATCRTSASQSNGCDRTNRSRSEGNSRDKTRKGTRSSTAYRRSLMRPSPLPAPWPRPGGRCALDKESQL